jgi:NADH-quinone oxidoreductase subunit M
MTWENSAITITTLLPLVGGLLILLVPKDRGRLIAGLGIAITGVALVLAAAIAIGFDYGVAGLQYELDVRWIDVINVRYHVGIDGISMPLYVLTFLLSFLCAIYTWRFVPEPGRPKAFIALMLLLETGMAGTFIAFDLILFFVFWELVLVPMYFLIGIWGSANREYAAIKFFLFTMFGSIFMLLGFLGMFFRSDPHTFDILQLQQFAQGGGFSSGFQLVVFGAVALGFAIKVPMWPFHTWLPDAHTEAPTIGSVLLAGVMLKMGTYAFIRIAIPLLPDAAATYAPWIGALAAIGIIYASLACLAQKDLKRLIAFSSVGHMGFVMLGIATMTEIGMQAAIFGMVAHGLITGMLFFNVGSIYDRYHTRAIAEIGGGMSQKMPKLASTFAYVSIASLGLPGLAGFWGEVMALLSAFNPNEALLGQHTGLFRAFMVMGGIGTILTAGYFLWMLQRVNMGTLPDRWRDTPLQDTLTIEWIAWAPLLVLILVLGLFPRVVFGMTDEAVAGLIAFFGG